MNQRKIKVMFITPWLKTGGAERMVVDVSIGLDKSRYDVSLFLFNQEDSDPEIWLPELEANNIKIIRINKPKKLNTPLLGGIVRLTQIFLAVKKVILSERPDIVQTQLFGDYVGRLAAHVSRVPVIISVEQNVNVGERWHVYMVNRLTTGLLTRHIAISKAIQEFIISRYRSAREKTEVIYSGVNVNKFLISKRSLKDPNSPIITFGAIGRLVPQKGFSVLIKALQRIDSTNYLCLIAGEGPLRSSLQAEIDAAHLSDRVKLIGIQKDVTSFLSSLDFFVMPSIWEGLGLVAMEAGLAGLPIVASRVDGLQEIVDDKTGFLVPPSDAQALADRIVFCLNPVNNGVLKETGKALQQKVLTHFSLDATIRGYDKLYQRLLVEKQVNLYEDKK